MEVNRIWHISHGGYCSYSLDRAKEYGFNASHIAILKWLEGIWNTRKSGKIPSIAVDGVIYYQFEYKSLMQDLPHISEWQKTYKRLINRLAGNDNPINRPYPLKLYNKTTSEGVKNYFRFNNKAMLFLIGDDYDYENN